MSIEGLNYHYTQLDEVASYADDEEIAELLNDLSDVIRAQERHQIVDATCKEPYFREAYFLKLDEFKRKWFHTSREERLTGYIDERIGKLRADLMNLIGVREAE